MNGTKKLLKSRSIRLGRTAPTSANSDLCSDCARLDFPKIIAANLHKPEELVRLNTFGVHRINAPHCAFCRLIAAAVARWLDLLDPTDRPSTAVSEATEIKLSSRSAKVPGVASLGIPGGYGVVHMVLQFAISAELLARLIAKGSDLRPQMGIYILPQDIDKLGLRFLEPGGIHQMRPVTGRIVARELLFEWMGICQQFHKHTCGAEIVESRLKLPKGFRVIDVLKMKLAPVTNQLNHGKRKTYAALSYVWGDSALVELYQTTVENFQQRLKRSGLSGVQFPKMIADAMMAVRRLGLRYLWIDAICIVQDDPADKAEQIMAMHHIYGGAHVTLVGPSSGSTQTGLPRAHDGSPGDTDHQYISETVQGLRMFLDQELPTLNNLRRAEGNKRLPWFTRGWTYQENLLSPRILFFTSWQAYFQCRVSAFRESLHVEQKILDMGYGGMKDTSNYSMARTNSKEYDGNFQGQYQLAVEGYTDRTLGRDSDGANAFQGIGQAMVERRNLPTPCLVYGLPESEFEGALMWYPAGEHARRDTEELKACDVWLPSWSWVGWRGPSTYGIELPAKSLGYQCLRSVVAGWVLHEPGGQSRQLKIEKIMQITPLHFKRYPDPPTAPDAATIQCARPPHVHPGTLEIVTSLAYLRIIIDDASLRQQIVDSEGIVAGRMIMSPDTARRLRLHERLAECIVIARSTSSGPNPVFDTAVYEDMMDCLFNVLLVERKDGIAYRIGLGLVHGDAWAAAKPEWMRIFLG